MHTCGFHNFPKVFQVGERTVDGETPETLLRLHIQVFHTLNFFLHFLVLVHDFFFRHALVPVPAFTGSEFGRGTSSASFLQQLFKVNEHISEILFMKRLPSGSLADCPNAFFLKLIAQVLLELLSQNKAVFGRHLQRVSNILVLVAFHGSIEIPVTFSIVFEQRLP
tara:strand:- start:2 stop:499 length:498 start_codon:yes stop_codon:yes gene_type:complete